jgi:cell division transport system permease protein
MKAWLQHHAQSMRQTLRRFGGSPFATLANMAVIGVVLALPLGGFALLTNLQLYAGALPTEPQISIFLSAAGSRQGPASLEAQLRSSTGVKRVRFVPKEAAIASLKRLPGVTDVIASLRENPLPDAFVVTLESAEASLSEQLAAKFKALPGVGSVQVDSDWARRIDSLLGIVKTATAMLALLLGFTLIAATFNTIRLQILTQREEIEVSKLVGATDSYVRLPFYYQGALLGLGGGVLALLLVQGALLLFNTDLARLGPVFGISPVLELLPAKDMLSVLFFSGLLGWLGSHLSVSRHLLTVEPS